MSYLVPIVILLLFAYALFKKVNVYDGFIDGAKRSLKISFGVFPYLVATFLMVNALQQSGVDKYLSALLSPPFALIGIPTELVNLMLIRPFSGSGSLAILSNVYKLYGADSYLSRSASVIFGSSETVFYLSAVYFSQTKVQKTGWAIPIALFCNLVGGILACLLCRVI